jgi:hypothetical protein
MNYYFVFDYLGKSYPLAKGKGGQGVRGMTKFYIFFLAGICFLLDDEIFDMTLFPGWDD